MIDLRFEINEAAFDLDAPERESPVTVEYNLFECPVFLIVDGVNILRHPVAGTTSLPLIGFAPRALQKLRLLQPSTTLQFTISDAGWMYFREHDGLVRISTSRFQDGVDVPIGDALTAFERITDEVKRAIVARVPTMVQHPQWGYWFPS